MPGQTMEGDETRAEVKTEVRTMVLGREDVTVDVAKRGRAQDTHRDRRRHGEGMIRVRHREGRIRRKQETGKNIGKSEAATR